MLDGLALGRRGSASDSTTDKDDELLDARSLEIAKVRDVGSVCEDDGIRSFGSALENEQRGDLHSSGESRLREKEAMRRRRRRGVGTWKNLVGW